MKTDELIGFLSTNIDQELPARRRAGRGILLAGLVSAALVVAIVSLLLGLRSDLIDRENLPFLVLKTGFALSVALIAIWYLARAARPGGEKQFSWALASLPFAGITTLGIAHLSMAPTSHWQGLLLGDLWLECLIAIPLLATVPFAAMIWIVKKTSAPTNLVQAGALAGLAAGAVSAMGYALHCVDDTVPFVALWYGGTIALCTLAGALLGPRLLRW
jgi:hypothetical protein